jgi:hypothetical protein
MIPSKAMELILKEEKFFLQLFSDTVAHPQKNPNSDTVIRYIYLPTSI